MITPTDFDWSDRAVVAQCQTMLAQGHSSAQIAARLTDLFGIEPALTKDLVQKRIQSLRRPSPFAVMPKADPTPVASALLARKAKGKRDWDRTIRSLARTDEIELLVISDTHGAMCDEAALAWALELGANADAVLVAGDVFDFANQSLRHDPIVHVPYEAEIEGGARVIQAVDSLGVPVLAVQGNHDVRVAKLVRAAAHAGNTFLLDLYQAGPLEVLAAHSDHWLVRDGRVESWWGQLGDAIWAHPEMSGGAKGVARKAWEAWSLRSADFGIDGPIGAVLAGHPHRLRHEYVGRTVLVDLPCLQGVPEYSRTAQGIRYTSPQTVGAVTATMRKGRIVPESVRPHLYPGVQIRREDRALLRAA